MNKSLKYIMIFSFAIVFSIFNQNIINGEDNFSISINPQAVGVIINKETNKQIGSAFVAGSQKHIFTCAHVATNGVFEYRGVSLLKDIPLKSYYFLPKYDLSVFISGVPFDGAALKFGDIKKVRPGDTIIYIGMDKALDINVTQMKVNKAVVYSIGAAMNDGVIVDFIEFQGEGIPGYSGGPVFDTAGNVIAIMREAWKKQGVKGGDAVLMNRAFSIEILSILDSEVYSIKGSEKEVQTDTTTLKKLLSIETDH